jgi:hypothetical protein
MRTHRQFIADTALGRPVEDYIASRRSEGTSWRRIAREIAEATGGMVDVTERTLRNWTQEVAA